jgi:hypothetical protein
VRGRPGDPFLAWLRGPAVRPAPSTVGSKGACPRGNRAQWEPGEAPLLVMSQPGWKEQVPSLPQSPFGPWLRLLLGLLGGASFGTGVVAVFVTENGTGTGVLLGFGGIVLVVALLGDRIESLEFGGSRLRMRAEAAERFALAEDSERQGDRITAARLRAEAQSLLDAAGPIAFEYRAIRGTMPYGPERTKAMRGVVARARQLATQHSFQPAEVARWLEHGTDEERITALAMMQAEPKLRNFGGVLMVIKKPRSGFEQYEALVLAEMMLAGLSGQDRQRLGSVIRSVRGFRFRRDAELWRLSERVLDSIDAVANGT